MEGGGGTTGSYRRMHRWGCALLVCGAWSVPRVGGDGVCCAAWEGEPCSVLHFGAYPRALKHQAEKVPEVVGRGFADALWTVSGGAMWGAVHKQDEVWRGKDGMRGWWERQDWGNRSVLSRRPCPHPLL